MDTSLWNCNTARYYIVRLLLLRFQSVAHLLCNSSLLFSFNFILQKMGVIFLANGLIVSTASAGFGLENRVCASSYISVAKRARREMHSQVIVQGQHGVCNTRGDGEGSNEHFQLHLLGKKYTSSIRRNAANKRRIKQRY